MTRLAKYMQPDPFKTHLRVVFEADAPWDNFKCFDTSANSALFASGFGESVSDAVLSFKRVNAVEIRRLLSERNSKV